MSMPYSQTDSGIVKSHYQTIIYNYRKAIKMTKTTTVCNMCGKEINKMDLACNLFSISNQFGYGSIHDGDTLELDLCSKCQDMLVTHLIETCKISPIVERIDSYEEYE